MKTKEKNAEGQDDEGHAQQGAEGPIKEVIEDKEKANRLANIWTKLRLEQNEMLKEKLELKRKIARLLEEYK